MSKIKKHKKPAGIKESNSTSAISEFVTRIINKKYFPLFISSIFFIIMIFISYSYHRIGDYGVETDFYQSYVPQARDFLSGILTIDSFRGPVYQVLLGITGFIFSDLFKAGIFIGVIAAATFIYFTFQLVKNMFSARTALLVILFVVLNPIFIQYTYSAGTDMLFAALLIISFSFLFKKDSADYKNLATGAFIGGVAYLTRYNGIFIAGFIVVILFINYWEINWRERLKASFVFLGTFILSITPWGVYCLIKKGSFFFNENFKNIAYELYGRGRISWENFWYGPLNEFKSMGDVISKDPMLMLKTVLGNIYANFVGDMGRLLGWYLGVLVILGILFYIASDGFVIRKKKSDRKKLAYYLMNTFFFLVLTFVFYSERFSFFLLPFYLMIVFEEFFQRSYLVASEFFRKRKILAGRGLKPLMNFFIILLIAISSYNTVVYNSSMINSGPQEILRLKDWYFKNVPEADRGKRIAARKPQVAYYLDMKFDVIPVADNLVQLLDILKKNKDDYLYFSWFEAGTRPKLRYLLDSGPDLPGLERMISFTEPPAVLYKVIKPGN